MDTCIPYLIVPSLFISMLNDDVTSPRTHSCIAVQYRFAFSRRHYTTNPQLRIPSIQVIPPTLMDSSHSFLPPRFTSPLILTSPDLDLSVHYRPLSYTRMIASHLITQTSFWVWAQNSARHHLTEGYLPLGVERSSRLHGHVLRLLTHNAIASVVR